jgi:hypothetical protein
MSNRWRCEMTEEGVARGLLFAGLVCSKTLRRIIGALGLLLLCGFGGIVLWINGLDRAYLNAHSTSIETMMILTLCGGVLLIGIYLLAAVVSVIAKVAVREGREMFAEED